jgi:hypothetical protein
MNDQMMTALPSTKPPSETWRAKGSRRRKNCCSRRNAS